MSAVSLSPLPRRILGLWPWLVLAFAAGMAVWHDVDFPNDIDPEYPAVVRPTFNRRPPAAYRLAEPGDTLDRIAIYASAAAVVLSGTGLILARRGLWPAALALSAASWWYAATPGPTFDGWHGLGWRTMLAPTAPAVLRLELAAAALVLIAVIAVVLWRTRNHWRDLWITAREKGIAGLLTASAALVVLRQFEIPGVEPVGYWPRWSFDIGLIAFNLALVRVLPRLEGRRLWLRRGAVLAGWAGVWVGLTLGGIDITWYHRPIDRFRAIVPGRIYICAMPTARGLDVVQNRHHFKTIINLFPEDTQFRSPRLPEELKFAKDHGIQYVVCSAATASSSAFLDKTLDLARDPDAWPVLVHCHACMDRTPAWWGIYRFIVQGDPLDAILRDIERHRGLRPKASVTLLYNHVLEPRSPERYAHDPTAALLKRCADRAPDPYADLLTEDDASANPDAVPRVSRRERREP